MVHSSVHASHGSVPAGFAAGSKNTRGYRRRPVSPNGLNKSTHRRQSDSINVPSPVRRIGIDTPRHAQQAREMHRVERHVKADKHQPEMPLPSVSLYIRPVTLGNQ